MYLLIAIVFVINYHSYKMDMEWNKTEIIHFVVVFLVRFYVEMNEKTDNIHCKIIAG